MVAGYRGTTHEQDSRWKEKERKLMKEKEWPEEFKIRIDLRKVDLRVIEPWIHKQITEILNFEDDIVINMVINYIQGNLEDPTSLDPRKMQIDITGFLERSVSDFMKDLWILFIEAQNTENGIPPRLIQEKKEEFNTKKDELIEKQKKLEILKQKIVKIDNIEQEKNIDKALKINKQSETGLSKEIIDKVKQDQKAYRKKRYDEDSSDSSVSHKRKKSKKIKKEKDRKERKKSHHKQKKRSESKHKQKKRERSESPQKRSKKEESKKPEIKTEVVKPKEQPVKKKAVSRSRSRSQSVKKNKSQKNEKNKKKEKESSKQQYSYLSSNSSSSESSSNDSDSSSSD